MKQTSVALLASLASATVSAQIVTFDGDDAGSAKYVGLYQQTLREAQDRVRALHGEARRPGRSER